MSAVKIVATVLIVAGLLGLVYGQADRLGEEQLMKRVKHLPLHTNNPSSRAALGGKVSHYRNKENIYSQGTPAYTLFYIQAGVRWRRL